ncbi:MAG: hypothetical protein K8S23_04545 [Candidatus Cloacimonetes bacterium]|nr:hypothetical protein [Candidatus Cloacimonadota bacterium]
MLKYKITDNKMIKQFQLVIKTSVTIFLVFIIIFLGFYLIYNKFGLDISILKYGLIIGIITSLLIGFLTIRKYYKSEQ